MKRHKRYITLSVKPRGSVLAVILVVMIVMSLIAMSVIKISEGHAIQTVAYQNEQLAMSTAEAAYEKAIYWMSDNPDLLMEMDLSGTTGSLSFPNARADYEVRFFDFVGYRPIFEVTANGYSGTFHRSIRVYTTQAASGWEMGQCRVPTGPATTTEVYFADGEIIDMPIHINSYGARDDSTCDINISGSPVFLEEVSMEEQRHSSGGWDKYQDVIDLFTEGISFDQPKSLISDEASVDKKIQWYKNAILNNLPEMVFTPQADSSVSEAQPAVQLEFFVGSDGKGYVRITDDCTVRGSTPNGAGVLDYKVQSGSDGTRFERYPIYAFHYIPENAESTGKRFTRTLESIQASTQYGLTQSPPCGMIFVDGNVVISSASENTSDPQMAILNVVQGKVAVISTGNIWIANSLTVSDRDDNGNNYPRQADGMPALDNPNGAALFAKGVIKVIDPGLVEQFAAPGIGKGQGVGVGSGKGKGGNQGGGSGQGKGSGGVPVVTGMVYEPIGNKDSGYADGDYHRNLPDPMIVEAAITVGGGGWGAENVRYPNGRETSGTQDDLIVRGTLTEVIRGVVGIIGRNGYQKNYYFDKRMLSGLIPGTVRLKGKFITVPGGWSDYRVDNKPQP